MVEMKFDDVVKGRPPKLHDAESGKTACSTFAAALSTHGIQLTPHEQILDYNCLGLSAQGPIRNHMLGLLINYMRIQITYADRAGCMISEEGNFSNDFSILPAVLIGVYRLSAERAGLQSGITPLSSANSTPLDVSAFDLADRAVQTGSMTNVARPIRPLHVLVELESVPGEDVAVYAHGINLMERPMAITEEAARSLYRNKSPPAAPRIRQPISRVAKTQGLKKNQAIAISEREELAAMRVVRSRCLFAPRSIFGSGLARYQCVLGWDPSQNAELTLQLSWQPECRLSEATVLRRANVRGVRGVPTLIGCKDIADMDGSSLRSNLRRTFSEIRPVRKVLRAIVLQKSWIPLSSVEDMDDFLSACQSIVESTWRIFGDGFQMLMSFSVAIVELAEAGIMHTNISEANMAVHRTRHGQGILVGFEFAIMREDPASQNKRARLDSDAVSADGATVGAGNPSKLASEVIPEQAPGDVTTHHVASLPLSRCMDRPPVHQFRHELESFCWSFFWILGCFRHGRRIFNPVLEKWYTGRWHSVDSAKRGFLLDNHLNRASQAAEFAKSLDVEPEPLIACSELLANMLGKVEQLNAVHIVRTLQDARDAYGELNLV
jgi:hypothetical protein